MLCYVALFCYYIAPPISYYHCVLYCTFRRVSSAGYRIPADPESPRIPQPKLTEQKTPEPLKGLDLTGCVRGLWGFIRASKRVLG